MIVLKRYDGESFQLLKNQLRQVQPTCGYKWRAVLRADLAKLFRGEGKIQAARLDAYFGDGDIFSNYWLAIYNGKMLTIGCQVFDTKETTRIRRWALKK